MVSNRMILTLAASVAYALVCKFLLKPLLSVSDFLLWAICIGIAVSIPKDKDKTKEKPGGGGIFVFIMVWIMTYTLLDQLL